MQIIDMDAHYYEPRDCFSAYIDPSKRHLAITAAVDDDGEEVVLMGDRGPAAGKAVHFMADTVTKPGGLKEMFRAGDSAAVERVKVPLDATMTDRSARVALLDEVGVHTQVLYPTTACLVWAELGDDAELIGANFTAFNRWLDETWGFSRDDGRLYAAPLVSLVDPEAAAASVEWALERGARAFCVPPVPPHGRHPADPAFDPMWARIEEAGALVVLHVGESGYVEQNSARWGEDPTAPPFMRTTFQWINFYNDTPIREMISAMIFGNLFGRFPDLKVASIENGSMWVPYLLRLMDKKRNLGALGPWIGGRLELKPSEYFRRNVWVAPFPEEDWHEMIDYLGADRVLFGSDYPHAEGLASPADWHEMLDGAKPDAIEKVLGGNAAHLLGLDS